jgi:hypothetical protein
MTNTRKPTAVKRRARQPSPECDEFMQWCRKFQGARSNKEMAAAFDVSVPAYNNYRNAIRRPHLERGIAIADKLLLRGLERDEFFAALRRCQEESPNTDAVGVAILKIAAQIVSAGTAQDRTPTVRDVLRSRLQEALQSWSAAQGEVQAAIVPIAGWQAELLASKWVAEFIAVMVHEARAANIRHVVAVVRPGMPTMLRQERCLQQYAADMTLDLREQSGPRGLGGAILQGAGAIPSKKPFAVLLPDEFPEASCLQRMIQQFVATAAPVVAMIAPPENAPTTTRGFARIPAGNTTVNPQLNHILEKPRRLTPIEPDERYMLVLGRYILTWDVVRELQRLADQAPSMPVELTDALANLIASRKAVVGHILSARPPRLSTQIRRQIREQIAKAVCHVIPAEAIELFGEETQCSILDEERVTKHAGAKTGNRPH